MEDTVNMFHLKQGHLCEYAGWSVFEKFWWTDRPSRSIGSRIPALPGRKNPDERIIKHLLNAAAMLIAEIFPSSRAQIFMICLKIMFLYLLWIFCCQMENWITTVAEILLTVWECLETPVTSISSEESLPSRLFVCTTMTLLWKT